MPERPATPDDAARPRFRSLITSFLFVMIALMIVRDMLGRRWGVTRRPASGVTQRTP